MVCYMYHFGYFLQVILPRVLARCLRSRKKFSGVRSFSILQSGEGSTSFNNDNSANFSGEKKYNEEFRGVYFLTIREKTLNQISYSYLLSTSNLKVSRSVALFTNALHEWDQN